MLIWLGEKRTEKTTLLLHFALLYLLDLLAGTVEIDPPLIEQQFLILTLLLCIKLQ